MQASRRFFGVFLALAALTLSASSAEAQVNTADARTFVGEWDLTFQGEQPFTMVLAIRDQEGKLAASTNTMGAEAQVTTIQKQETALVLGYTFDYQGQPVPISITLTPGQQGVQASLAAMGGSFTVAGTAKKR